MKIDLQVARGIDRKSAEQFYARLLPYLKSTCTVRINANRSTLLSYNHSKVLSRPVLSVNTMFLAAPDNVVRAIGMYASGDHNKARGVLRSYMNSRQQDLEDHERPELPPLRSKGAVYDLHRMADEINQEFFGGKVEVYVTWGRGNRNVSRPRHIVFGSYQATTRLVRMHPMLDNAGVPEYFVRFVLFHEMLHAVLDTRPQPGGRRCVHTQEFRNRERMHPDYVRAMRWEKEFMSGKVSLTPAK